MEKALMMTNWPVQKSLMKLTSMKSLSFITTTPFALPLMSYFNECCFFWGAGIWDYVIQITNSIHDLEQRVQKTKDNVEEIQRIMKTWVSPIFKRRDGKKECLLSMDDQHDRVEKYYHLIKESGLKIHALVQVITSLSVTHPTTPGNMPRRVFVC